jgi:hypothetical protein
MGAVFGGSDRYAQQRNCWVAWWVAAHRSSAAQAVCVPTYLPQLAAALHTMDPATCSTAHHGPCNLHHCTPWTLQLAPLHTMDPATCTTAHHGPCNLQSVLYYGSRDKGLNCGCWVAGRCNRPVWFLCGVVMHGEGWQDRHFSESPVFAVHISDMRLVCQSITWVWWYRWVRSPLIPRGLSPHTHAYAPPFSIMSTTLLPCACSTHPQQQRHSCIVRGQSVCWPANLSPWLPVQPLQMTQCVVHLWAGCVVCDSACNLL